jgi:hypothetical protein
VPLLEFLLPPLGYFVSIGEGDAWGYVDGGAELDSWGIIGGRWGAMVIMLFDLAWRRG